jgi:hypothetical protein
MRYLICSVALLLCLAGLKWLLSEAFQNFGFSTGMAACLALGFGSIALGFAIDARDRRHFREARQPRRLDHQ